MTSDSAGDMDMDRSGTWAALDQDGTATGFASGPGGASVGGLVSVFEWVDAWRGVATRHGSARAVTLLGLLMHALRCDPSAWVDRTEARALLGNTTRRDAVRSTSSLALVAWTAACGYRAQVAPSSVYEPSDGEASSATLVPPALRLGGWGLPVLLSSPIQ